MKLLFFLINGLNQIHTTATDTLSEIKGETLCCIWAVWNPKDDQTLIFIFQMEELRAHATDWTQNIQNMSVDFNIAGKIDDPFKRRRRKRRHGHRSHGHSVSATGAPEGNQEQHQSQTESGSYSSTSSSYESGSESETDSQATQTERVPEEPKKEEPPLEPHLSQPLDYFGENLAFIDESSDAQSGKLHLNSLLDPIQPNSRQAKRRRHRRPVQQRGSKINGSSNNKKQPNGNPTPVPDLPVMS